MIMRDKQKFKTSAVSKRLENNINSSFISVNKSSDNISCSILSLNQSQNLYKDDFKKINDIFNIDNIKEKDLQRELSKEKIENK